MTIAQDDRRSRIRLVNLDRWEFFNPYEAMRANSFTDYSVREMCSINWSAQILSAATVLLMRMRQEEDGKAVPPHDWVPGYGEQVEAQTAHMERQPGMLHAGRIYLSEKIVGSWEADRIAYVSEGARVSARLEAIARSRGRIRDSRALYGLCLDAAVEASEFSRNAQEDRLQAQFNNALFTSEGPVPWIKDITWDLMPALERFLGVWFSGECAVHSNPGVEWSALTNSYPLGDPSRVPPYTVRPEMLAPIPPRSRIRFSDADDPTPATVVRPSRRQLGW